MTIFERWLATIYWRIVSPRIEKSVRSYYSDDKVTETQKVEQQTQLKYVKTKKLHRVMLQLNLKKQGV